MVADGEGDMVRDEAHDSSRDRVRDESHDANPERHARSLEDEVQHLRNELDQEREANRENNLIISALEQRIAELEASQTKAAEPERRDPHLPTVEGEEHPRAHKVPEKMKNAAVVALFVITAGASIVADAVFVISVANRQALLAVLAGALALLLIAGLLSQLWLFQFDTADVIQGKLSEPHQERQAAKKKLPLHLDFLLQLLVSVVLVFGVVKPFVVEPFYIPSESMVPTLEVGDRVLANKFIYRFKAPSRGDIVVFNSVEGNTQQMLIKRVIGLPGDKIELRNGNLFLNGQRHNEPYVVNKPCAQDMPKTCSYGPVRVPKERYFVMGDNRAKSADSRYIGPIPGDDIKGEAFLRWWPPLRAGLL